MADAVPSACPPAQQTTNKQSKRNRLSGDVDVPYKERGSRRIRPDDAPAPTGAYGSDLEDGPAEERSVAGNEFYEHVKTAKALRHQAKEHAVTAERESAWR